MTDIKEDLLKSNGELFYNFYCNHTFIVSK